MSGADESKRNLFFGLALFAALPGMWPKTDSFLGSLVEGLFKMVNGCLVGVLKQIGERNRDLVVTPEHGAAIKKVIIAAVWRYFWIRCQYNMTDGEEDEILIISVSQIPLPIPATALKEMVGHEIRYERVESFDNLVTNFKHSIENVVKKLWVEILVMADDLRNILDYDELLAVLRPAVFQYMTTRMTILYQKGADKQKAVTA